MFYSQQSLTLKISSLFFGLVLILANPDDIVPGKITADQKKTHVKVNESVTLSCHVQGYPLSNFTWIRGFSEDVEISTKFFNTSSVNETYVKMSLHLTNVSREDDTIYRCRVHDFVGPIDDFMYLTVADVPKVSVRFSEAVAASSVYLAWTVDDGKDPVKQYSYQRIKNGTEQWKYYPVVIGEAGYYNYQVFGELENGTTYKFGVIATNSIGNSKVAYSKWVTTLEKDPCFIPNITIAAVTTNSVTIERTVPPAGLNDYIYYYSVILSHEDEIKKYRWPSIEHSFVIGNLASATSYQLKVAAYNSYTTQCDDWSVEKDILTMDKDLKFIPTVFVKATTLHSISIGWSIQLKIQKYIDHYKVVATSPDDIRGPITLASNVNSYVFENLTSDTVYQLKVAACLMYAVTECGGWSVEQDGFTIDRDPEFVPSISVKAETRDSIWIWWSMPPPKLRDRVYQYKVIATHRDEIMGPYYLPKTANSYVFGNLESETKYKIKVAACSDYITQCGNWSSEIEASTKDIDVPSMRSKEETVNPLWPISITVVVLLVIVLVVWMSIQKHGELARRRKFIEVTIARFNKGVLDGLNPELDICDQAELLPYDKKWEFPRELLKLDKVLGSGSFGVVRKAAARSICRSEAISTVAVKLVRSTASLNHMTALTRELKILVHLGKHLNIVNLLGACTKKVSYGELLVIVEFCRFGNLRDYLLNRRADFVNQAVLSLGNQDVDSNSDVDSANANDSGVDTTGCGGVSKTTELCPISTNLLDLSVKADENVVEDDSIQTSHPESSKYNGDYEDKNLAPICTRDLLCWAWQVSRGMKYLGTRRVLHGDLAARNILLADNNVVKICDFGLAKALYTEDNYKKTGHDPLPVKWMSIEAIRDRLFSVHSDIWSFGIVLWEFFTLGETPYPGIGNENVYQKIADGFRMAKPKYATEDIYHMMLRCWHVNPLERPLFEDLGNSIARLLDESIKTVVVDTPTSAREYRYPEVDPDSPVNSDLHFDSQLMHLYVMTRQKISKVKVRECSVYETCHDCTNARDPYCGWCLLESRWSLRSDCQDAATDAANWILYRKCTTIVNVIPNQLQGTTARTLNLILENLPTLSEQFFCDFAALGKSLITNATRESHGVKCTTPSTDLLPSIPEAQHHFTAKLSVRMSSGPNLATINFTFFDCNRYSSYNKPVL